MSDSIKMGDTVRLKSGGPLMTVGAIREKDDEQVQAGESLEGGAICAWFEALQGCSNAAPTAQMWGAARAGEFHVDMLVKAEPEAK